MEKIYYQKNTGYVCQRYPYDIPIEDETQFIEVEDKVAEETYACECGKTWAVIDGALQVIPIPGAEESPEYQEMKKQSRMADLQEFLDNTDYIIVKLNELRLEDEEEYETEKERYADVLAQRKAARQELRELKGE